MAENGRPRAVPRDSPGESGGSRGLVRVEVAYATREEQVIVCLELSAGASARQAIERSGILRRFPELDLDGAPVGIFGRLTGRDAPLRDGDRVEIYRALAADPGEARRKKVNRQKRPGRKTRE